MRHARAMLLGCIASVLLVSWWDARGVENDALSIPTPEAVATPALASPEALSVADAPEPFAAGAAGFSGNVEAQQLSSAFSQSLLPALGIVFLIGLALNLTPCVYPMLAVTVSIFGGTTNGRRGSGRSFLMALVYVLGMATMYSTLGVAAALTGGLFGGLLQSPVVLVGIGALFFALALSMFGLYELRLPDRLAARLGGAQTAGWAGMFLSGLLVGIFAAPCVGPPLIALLVVVGQRADPMFGFMVFFVLSLGLGLPYLILGTFSGLLSKLPRSGSWMVWVKKVFGVVLIAVAFFYTALALQPEWIFVAIPLVLGTGGVYLGFVETSRSKGPVFVWVKRLTGVGFVVGALLLAQVGQKPSIEWSAYAPGVLEQARGRPAVLYFTATWCLPCLELDRLTFTDQTVQTEMARRTAVKVDISRSDSLETEALRRSWGVMGPPALIFLDGAGSEIAGSRVVGFVDAATLLGRLRETEYAVGQQRLEAGPAGDNDAEEAPPSEAQLVADVEWIRPGHPFRIGILFRMDAGWHTYWVNAGDSGGPPRIIWDLPDGFTVGDAQWPLPESFTDQSFTTYGYEDELLLMFDVTPPETLEPGVEVSIAAEIEWLVCKEICIPVNARPVLTLGVRAEAPPPSPTWASRFDEERQRLPALSDRWRFSARANGNRYELAVRLPEGWSFEDIADAEFFPSQSGFLKSGRYRWIKTASGASLSIAREGAEPADGMLKGVMALPERKASEFGHPRAVVVDVPIER